MMGFHVPFMRTGNISAAQAFWEAVKDIKAKTGGSAASLHIDELLDIKDAKGPFLIKGTLLDPPYQRTGRANEKRSAIIEMWGNMIKEAKDKGWLDDEKISTILNPKINNKFYLQVLVERVSKLNTGQQKTDFEEELKTYIILLAHIGPSPRVMRKLYGALAPAIVNKTWFGQEFSRIQATSSELTQILERIISIMEER